MKKGDKVVMLLSGAGRESASIQVVKSATKTGIKLVDITSTVFHRISGRCLNEAIPGFSRRIVVLEQ